MLQTALQYRQSRGGIYAAGSGQAGGTISHSTTSPPVVTLDKLTAKERRTRAREFRTQTSAVRKMLQTALQHRQSRGGIYAAGSGQAGGSGARTTNGVLHKTYQAGRLKITGLSPAEASAAIIQSMRRTRAREFRTQTSAVSEILQTALQYRQSRGGIYAGSGQAGGTIGKIATSVPAVALDTPAGKQRYTQARGFQTQAGHDNGIVYSNQRVIQDRGLASDKTAGSKRDGTGGRKAAGNPLQTEQINRWAEEIIRQTLAGEMETLRRPPIGVKYETRIQKKPAAALYMQVLRQLEQYADRRLKLRTTAVKPVRGQQFGKREVARAWAAAKNTGAITRRTFAQARGAPPAAGEINDSRRPAMTGNNMRRAGRIEQLVQKDLAVKTETLRRYETTANTRMEFLKQQAPPAGSRQSDAVSQSPAQVEVNLEKTDAPVSQNPEININRIADKVYLEIERKIKHERQRRGF